MPREIIGDRRLGRIDALVMGEGELVCNSLLEHRSNRSWLPGVWYRGDDGRAKASRLRAGLDVAAWTAPNIDLLPFVDRTFLAQDPHRTRCGRLESNLDERFQRDGTPFIPGHSSIGR